MIRLAVLDPDRNRWQSIASRLHGVVILAAASLESCDAALCSAPQIESSLRAGKHVLLLANSDLTKANLQAWDDMARAAKVRLSVVNPDRYVPSRQLIRQQVDAGKLGEPGLVRIHRWESNPAILCDLDLILWQIGKAPNLVFAVENEACTQVHLGFPGGEMALLTFSKRPLSGNSYCSLSIIGSSGAAYADDHQNTQLLYRNGMPESINTSEGVTQWAAIVQEFVNLVALPSDRAVIESFPTWTHVLTVKDAVTESLRSKRAVAPEGVA